MAAAPLIVGIDPSCTCTGWAVLEHDGSLLGRLVEGGTIKPKEGTLAERVDETCRDLLKMLMELEVDRVGAIVVEFPARSKRPPSYEFGNRSILTLPNYGVMVGAVYLAIMVSLPKGAGAQVLTPASDEWTGGDIPSSAGDDHKTQRVAYVTSLYNLKPGSLGAKTYAGNVADAVLLARWGLFRLGDQP
jgi:hypothetical protein